MDIVTTVGSCLARLCVVLLAAGSVCSPRGARAATIFYHRFEDSPGFLQDSSGNGNTLVDNSADGRSVTNVLLPGTGAGSKFPNPIPRTGEPNLKSSDFEGHKETLKTAASLSSVPTNAYTLEVFLNWRSAGDNKESASDVILETLNWPISKVGVSFQIRTDGFNSSDPNGEVMIRMSDSANGDTIETFNSGFNTHSSPRLQFDKDYYFAVRFKQSTPNIQLLVKNLTGGGEAFVTNFPHTIGGVLPSSATNLWLGCENATDAVDFDGLIDEVRLSDTWLPDAELLITPHPPLRTVLRFR